MSVFFKRFLIFILVGIFGLLALYGFMDNKRLSDGLKLAKEVSAKLVDTNTELTNQIVQLNLKIKEQDSATEGNQELYAKLAAKLHEEVMAREALEKELAQLKQKK